MPPKNLVYHGHSMMLDISCHLLCSDLWNIKCVNFVLFFKNVGRCEPFDTYPRTYDLLHAAGLFSVEKKRYVKYPYLFFSFLFSFFIIIFIGFSKILHVSGKGVISQLSCWRWIEC